MQANFPWASVDYRFIKCANYAKLRSMPCVLAWN